MKHGALHYKECVLITLALKGLNLPFPKMAQTSEDEVVIFAYIEFESRAHRDEVNAKVMADPDMQAQEPGEMPLNEPPYGGFEVLVG